MAEHAALDVPDTTDGTLAPIEPVTEAQIAAIFQEAGVGAWRDLATRVACDPRILLGTQRVGHDQAIETVRVDMASEDPQAFTRRVVAVFATLLVEAINGAHTNPARLVALFRGCEPAGVAPTGIVSDVALHNFARITIGHLRLALTVTLHAVGREPRNEGWILDIFLEEEEYVVRRWEVLTEDATRDPARSRGMFTTTE